MANYPLLVGRHFPSPIIMGHFGESSYANLLFTNSTILTTITAIFACCNAVRIVQWPVYTLLFQVILQIVIKKIILWPLEWQHKFDDFGFCVFFNPKRHKNYDNISLNFQQKKYINYIYIYKLFFLFFFLIPELSFSPIKWGTFWPDEMSVFVWPPITFIQIFLTKT